MVMRVPRREMRTLSIITAHQEEAALVGFQQTLRLCRVRDLARVEPHALVFNHQQHAAVGLAEAPDAHFLVRILLVAVNSGLRAAQLEFAQLREKGRVIGTTPLDVAYAYGILQDIGKTLEWLNRSLHDRKDHLIFVLKSAPEFDFLRSDPRFKDLLRRANLPP
jgi:hypothetical protein